MCFEGYFTVEVVDQPDNYIIMNFSAMSDLRLEK